MKASGWTVASGEKDRGKKTDAQGFEGLPHSENSYNVYAKWLIFSVKLYY